MAFISLAIIVALAGTAAAQDSQAIPRCITRLGKSVSDEESFRLLTQLQREFEQGVLSKTSKLEGYRSLAVPFLSRAKALYQRAERENRSVLIEVLGVLGKPKSGSEEFLEKLSREETDTELRKLAILTLLAVTDDNDTTLDSERVLALVSHCSCYDAASKADVFSIELEGNTLAHILMYSGHVKSEIAPISSAISRADKGQKLVLFAALRILGLPAKSSTPVLASYLSCDDDEIIRHASLAYVSVGNRSSSLVRLIRTSDFDLTRSIVASCREVEAAIEKRYVDTVRNCVTEHGDLSEFAYDVLRWGNDLEKRHLLRCIHSTSINGRLYKSDEVDGFLNKIRSAISDDELVDLIGSILRNAKPPKPNDL